MIRSSESEINKGKVRVVGPNYYINEAQLEVESNPQNTLLWGILDVIGVEKEIDLTYMIRNGVDK